MDSQANYLLFPRRQFVNLLSRECAGRRIVRQLLVPAKQPPQVRCRTGAHLRPQFMFVANHASDLAAPVEVDHRISDVVAMVPPRCVPSCRISHYRAARRHNGAHKVGIVSYRDWHVQGAVCAGQNHCRPVLGGKVDQCKKDVNAHGEVSAALERLHSERFAIDCA